MPTDDARAGQETADRWDVFARARATLDALEHLFSGLGTVVLALVALLLVIGTALTCLVGVGLLPVPAVLRGLRAITDRERARLSRQRNKIFSGLLRC
jgi:hypothetical protein